MRLEQATFSRSRCRPKQDFAILAIRSIAMPANDSNSDTYKHFDNIRRSAEYCETFSFDNRLAFAHIATTRFDITSVFQLAQFIRFGTHMLAIHATRASNLVSTSWVEQTFATSQFKASQRPRTTRDPEIYRLLDSIRRSTDFCETFSFKHNVDIETSKSRTIAIGDIATLADMSLSMPD